jgi:hypothetical protein
MLATMPGHVTSINFFGGSSYCAYRSSFSRFVAEATKMLSALHAPSSCFCGAPSCHAVAHRPARVRLPHAARPALEPADHIGQHTQPAATTSAASAYFFSIRHVARCRPRHRPRRDTDSPTELSPGERHTQRSLHAAACVDKAARRVSEHADYGEPEGRRQQRGRGWRDAYALHQTTRLVPKHSHCRDSEQRCRHADSWSSDAGCDARKQWKPQRRQCRRGYYDSSVVQLPSNDCGRCGSRCDTGHTRGRLSKQGWANGYVVWPSTSTIVAVIFSAG